MYFVTMATVQITMLKILWITAIVVVMTIIIMTALMVDIY